MEKHGASCCNTNTRLAHSVESKFEDGVVSTKEMEQPVAVQIVKEVKQPYIIGIEKEADVNNIK